MQPLNNCVSFLLDLIFPPICISCDSFGDHFCKRCQAKIVINHEGICPGCLTVQPTGKKHDKCKSYIDGLTSCWSYEGVVQTVIKEVKYRFYYAALSDITRAYLTVCTSEKYPDLFQFLDLKPVVVPVPLHKKRLNLRGFNQAGLIGKSLAKAWNLPFSDRLIERIHYTQPQAGLGKEERIKNIGKAFGPSKKVLELGNNPLKGKNVLLVDDVWTTGSTMHACGKVLKELGTEKIWAVTLAR